ncbi:PAS domain S-box protein [Methanofollis fontis]|uniref:Histidine kinase n=1 Tax=Methanofollis fontis TaxID=2052832 RepID=A0A483CVD6_9EURY|nr:PAS domain S-box protein [Methanofollis fontis]TAJ43358.1 histidine kinase [Methanofollis fontis]
MGRTTSGIKDAIAIRELLRNHPKGLSISEIAAATGLHRNTAAKYLEMLALKGDVDRKQIGTARNYFLARRVPVSALLHIARHPTIVVNARLEVEIAGGQALELLGCTLEVIYGERLGNLPFPMFTDSSVIERCREAVAGVQAVVPVTTTFSGARHDLSLHLIPVVFDTGREGAAIVLIDESGERRAAAERETWRRRHEALTADGTEFVLATADDLTITLANEAFCRHAGKQRDHLIGHRFLPLFPPAERERAAQALAALTPDSPARTLDLRTVGRDGSMNHERWTFRALFDNDGTPDGYHLTGRDITAEKHCEERLHDYHTNMESLITRRTAEMAEANRTLLAVIAEKEEVEQELLFTRFAFDHASDSILLFDEGGTVYQANKTACDLLGYSPAEILEATAFGINPSITPGRWKRMWTDARPGRREQIRSVHRRKNGTVFDVEVSRTFVRFADRTYFCSIAREIQNKPGEGEQ